MILQLEPDAQHVAPAQFLPPHCWYLLEHVAVGSGAPQTRHGAVVLLHDLFAATMPDEQQAAGPPIREPHPVPPPMLTNR
jgi:hypothetical protein